MNQSDMLLQMACMAVQSAQNTLSQSAGTKKSDGGQDFRTLLDEKRTAVNGQEVQQPAEQEEQKTEPSADAMAQAAVMLQTAMTPTAATIATGEAQPQAVDAAAAITAMPEVVPESTQSAQPAVPEAGAQAVIPETTAEPTTAQPLSQTPVKATETSAETEAPAAETVSTPQTQQNSAPEDDEESAGQDRPAPENGKTVRTNDYEVLAAQSGTAERPLFRESESLPQRVGDAPVLDTQSGHMDARLTKELTSALDAGSQRLELKLTPERLGTVVVEMNRTPEGALHVVLRTENEQAAKLLTEHSGTLGMMLQSSQQGEVRIEVQRQDQGETTWQQPDQNGGQSGQERQQQEQRRQPADPERFLQQLRLGLVTAAQ